MARTGDEYHGFYTRLSKRYLITINAGRRQLRNNSLHI